MLRGKGGKECGELLTGLRSQVAALRHSGCVTQRPRLNTSGEGACGENRHRHVEGTDGRQANEDEKGKVEGSQQLTG